MCTTTILYVHNYFYTAVEDTNQNCTIFPLHPSFLTAAGGMLYNGTSNVMIRCNCTNTEYQEITWYSPNSLEIPFEHRNNNSPYVVQENGTLIIPIFTELYEGIYHCGTGNNSIISADIQLVLFAGKCNPIFL